MKRFGLMTLCLVTAVGVAACKGRNDQPGMGGANNGTVSVIGQTDTVGGNDANGGVAKVEEAGAAPAATATNTGGPSAVTSQNLGSASQGAMAGAAAAPAAPTTTGTTTTGQ